MPKSKIDLYKNRTVGLILRESLWGTNSYRMSKVCGLSQSNCFKTIKILEKNKCVSNSNKLFKITKKGFLVLNLCDQYNDLECEIVKLKEKYKLLLRGELKNE